MQTISVIILFFLKTQYLTKTIKLTNQIANRSKKSKKNKMIV